MSLLINPNLGIKRESKILIDSKELIEAYGLQPLEIAEANELSMKTTVLKNDWDPPIKFNLEKEMKTFRASGILRKIEIRRTSEIFERFFYSKPTEKLIVLLFWICFCRKCPDNVKTPADFSESILVRFQKRMCKRYAKILFNVPPPKTEVMDSLLFSSIFLCFMLFFSTFTEDRNKISLKFLLEIYHICLFEINGLQVSDAFIVHTIERIFNPKMLNYGKEADEEKHSLNKESQDRSTEASISGPSVHSFLGVPLLFPGASFENSVFSDNKDQSTFRERLKRQLTPRVVKFEPLPKRLNTREVLSYKSLSPSRSREEKVEELSFNDFETEKSLKEPSSMTVAQKKKKLLKKKNFLEPIVQEIKTAPSAEQEEGKFGKNFNCRQVSPRINEFLGINREPMPGERREVKPRTAKRNLKPALEGFVKKDVVLLGMARRYSTENRVHKLDMYQILIDKMVRTTMRKNQELFNSDVFNKYALLIQDKPVLKKQTKLVENLLGHKLTLDECDSHIHSVIHDQGYNRVKDLNDNEEYFKYFKKNLHRERKPDPSSRRDDGVKRYSLLITEGITKISRGTDNSREGTFVEKGKQRRMFHSPQQESRGSVHSSQDSEFDFLKESDVDRGRFIIDTTVFRNKMSDGKLLHKSKRKKYFNEHSSIVKHQETDAKIAEILHNLDQKKRKLSRGLTAIKNKEGQMQASHQPDIKKTDI